MLFNDSVSLSDVPKRLKNEISMYYAGVAIEISSAKDGSLSVVITGKEETVKTARKLVLQQLQTQVCYI